MDKREFLQHYMVARAGTVSNTSVTQDFGYALDAWCAIEAGCKDDAEPKPKPLDYVHKYSLPAPCSPCDDCSEFKAEPTC